MKKIIITNKFKGHMVAHKKEFLEPFENLIKEFEMSKEFQKLEDDFCKITFNFNRAIGFNRVINIGVNEKAIYAKRIGREIYSKFVKRKELGVKTSKVVFILNKNKREEDSYFLITMFPGEECEKEPEDKSIKDVSELEKCLNFWRNRAFIYDERSIDVNTIRYSMPYKELYKKLNTKKALQEFGFEDFNEMFEDYFKFLDENNLNEKVSNSPMNINILPEIYYMLLWRDPLNIGTEAIFNIFHLGLFQKLGYCKDKDVYEWINKQSREEYYKIIADILSEQNELMNINVIFKGAGRYDIALVERKNGLELCVMKVEDIMLTFDTTLKNYEENIREV
ncbi:hypothetical protein B0H39_004889 [Clostridium beijerinckii]|uniref:hypothetical protein n=1 Tax=Clostridium beijerinckii TaxID=1520 RepID=UPI001494057F|nr:hypothetical protein [Clostridium beijerinckii]NOW87008.1 hypothetical protein [Clostridium beijerinckii]